MYMYSQREITNTGCLVRLMIYPFVVLLSRTWRILNYYTIQDDLQVLKHSTHNTECLAPVVIICGLHRFPLEMLRSEF